MVKLIKQGVYFMEGHLVKEAQAFMTSDKREKAIKNTVLYSVLSNHIAEKGDTLKLKINSVSAQGADAVETFQLAQAAGVTEFALPFVAGGGVCADENTYSLAAAKKFGADFVPARLGFGDYVRDYAVKSGEVVLGAGERPACGALGAFGVKASCGEAVSVLSGKVYETEFPQTVAVYLRGKLRKGVGSLDVALSLLQAVSTTDFAEHKILEFFGAGLSNLSMEMRNAIDASIAETNCFTTVWETDAKTEEFLKERGREKAFKALAPKQPAYYDFGITIDLSRIEPMISLPLSSREILPLRELLENPETAAKLQENGLGSLKNGKILAENAVLSGGYETVAEAAEILGGTKGTSTFSLFVSPSSQTAFRNLTENGYVAALLAAGAELHSAGCALPEPSFGGLSVCHTDGAPISGFSVAYMDARSIAATAKNGGALTSALDYEYNKRLKKYKFDTTAKESAYCGAKKPNGKEELPVLPTVAELPELSALDKNLLLKTVACVKEPLTQADLFAGEAFGRFRSNPAELAKFVLAEKDALCAQRGEAVRAENGGSFSDGVKRDLGEFKPAKGSVYGGVICANELCLNAYAERTALALRLFGCRAFVCKKELNGATRKALIGAGIVPLTAEKLDWKANDTLYFADLTGAISRGDERVVVKIITRGKSRDMALTLGTLTAEEKAVLLAGGSINYGRE